MFGQVIWSFWLFFFPFFFVLSQHILAVFNVYPAAAAAAAGSQRLRLF
jgi:hypothetical protein